MCAGNSIWPPGWVTCALCVLVTLCCVPYVHSSLGPRAAAIASPTGASGPQPPVAVNGSSSITAKGDLSSTVPTPAAPKPQTQRALAVLVVVSAAVIIYFVIRTIRTRRKNKKTRKYGVLDTNIGNMELTPLEQEEEDDDTLFDANQPRRCQVNA
ncbi:membrane protein FAM174A isoform X2 [Hyla sarda]|uniref:membrane protein FAM174A isoform X2 n=1 Tax=Hyla sarda TaxID=327740 RepID=UPI0024C2D48E|nr:membrane protein FAM174A isoform X2 [Hyla sarda]